MERNSLSNIQQDNLNCKSTCSKNFSSFEKSFREYKTGTAVFNLHPCNDNLSINSCSPVKRKDESKIIEDADILEKIDMMKENTKRGESMFKYKPRLSSVRIHNRYLSDQSIAGYHGGNEFPSLNNSSNFILRSGASSSTVGKDFSFNDDTLNNSTQNQEYCRRPSIKIRDSSEHMKDSDISKRKLKNMEEIICELSEENSQITPNTTPRKLDDKRREMKRAKRNDLNIELKTLGDSSFDSDYQQKQVKPTIENFSDAQKSPSLEVKSNVGKEPKIINTNVNLTYKTTNIYITNSNAQHLSNHFSDSSLKKNQVDKKSEAPDYEGFQLHNIIFNNSLNRDLSKIVDRQANKSTSIIIVEELENNSVAFDNLMSQILTLSPSNQRTCKENKGESQNSNNKIDKNPKLMNNEVNLNILNPIDRETPILSSMKEQSTDTKLTATFNNVLPNSYFVVNSQSLNQPIQSNNPVQLGLSPILSEEETFVRFNKRGWICVSCANFNFESKYFIIFNFLARLECNRCKATKNSRKKYLDPITGLYIEKLPKSLSSNTNYNNNKGNNLNPQSTLPNQASVGPQNQESKVVIHNNYGHNDLKGWISGAEQFSPFNIKVNQQSSNQLYSNPSMIMPNSNYYSSNSSQHQYNNQSNYMPNRGYQHPNYGNVLLKQTSNQNFQSNNNVYLMHMQNSQNCMVTGYQQQFSPNQYYSPQIFPQPTRHFYSNQQ